MSLCTFRTNCNLLCNYRCLFRSFHTPSKSYSFMLSIRRYSGFKNHFHAFDRKAALGSKLQCWLFPERRNGSSATVDSAQEHYQKYMDGFNAAYRDVVASLTKQNADIPPQVAERVIKVLDYNVLGGKKIRGLTLLLAYHMLSKKSPSSDEMALAHILGWCIEMLQGFFVIDDDIMDGGITRRGKPCWYRLPDVGLESINDGILLESCIYQLIKNHFANSKCYNELVNEFLEVTRKTIYGQCLDMMYNPCNQPPLLEKFSLSSYQSIVELKTSHYTFCLPVHLAMHLIGSFSKEHYKAVRAICFKVGYLFQMQDDYLDVYGNFELTGKAGSDVKEGKCTWFSATALEYCSAEGKMLMKEHYGVDDPASVEKVLHFYDTMGLKERYLVAEERLHAEASSLISELDQNIFSKQLFVVLLNNIYRREK